MASEGCEYKFHTDDMLLPKSCYYMYLDWRLCCEENLLQPIWSTTPIWLLTCYQYGISVLVLLTSYRGETSDGLAQCCLFSQANNDMKKAFAFFRWSVSFYINFLRSILLVCFCFSTATTILYCKKNLLVQSVNVQYLHSILLSWKQKQCKSVTKNCIAWLAWLSRSFTRVHSLFILGSCVSISKAVYFVIFL